MAAVQTSDVTTYQMYIGGRWVDASNRETSEILDPSSENVIARVPRATVADAETAVKAARAAFDTGPWPRMKAVERGEILRRGRPSRGRLPGDHRARRRDRRLSCRLAAGPGDHLEDALGKADLFEDLRQFEIGQRADGGRLEDHHVTGRERRRGLPGSHEHRVVPRRDADGDADRLAHDHAHRLAGHVQRLAVRLDHQAGV